MDQNISDIITSQQVPITQESNLVESARDSELQHEEENQRQVEHLQEQYQQEQQQEYNNENEKGQVEGNYGEKNQQREDNNQQGEQYHQQNQDQAQSQQYYNQGQYQQQQNQENNVEGEERRSGDQNQVDQHALQNEEGQVKMEQNQDQNLQHEQHEQYEQTQEHQELQEQEYQQQEVYQQQEQDQHHKYQNNSEQIQVQHNQNEINNEQHQQYQNIQNQPSNEYNQHQQNVEKHVQNNQQQQNYHQNQQQVQKQQKSSNNHYHQQQQLINSNNCHSQLQSSQPQQLTESNQLPQSQIISLHHEQKPNIQHTSTILPPSHQYFQSEQQQQVKHQHSRLQELDERRKIEYDREPYALYHREEELKSVNQISPADQSIEDLSRSQEVIEESRGSTLIEERNSVQESNSIIQQSYLPIAPIPPPRQPQPKPPSTLSSTLPPIIPILIQQQQLQQEPIPIVQPQIPPHDDFQVMILPPQGLQPSTIGNMYSSAFQQRRQINRKLMMQLFDKRNHYYLNHVGVFDHIRLGLRLRIKNSRQAIDSFKQFFKEQIQIYNDVINSMKNIVELRGKAQTETLKVHWSEGVTQGVYRNLEDGSQIVDMMRSYRTLIDENFMQQMEQAYREYEKTLETCEGKAQQARKQFSKFEEKVIDMQKDVHKKFKKEQKYPDKKNKSYDMAEQQIILFRQMRIGKHKLTNWGETIIEWWQSQISQQITLLTRIKQLVNNFVDLTNKIHIISQHIRARSSAWSLQTIQPDVLANYAFQNIVCLTDIDFIRGSLETHNRLPRPDNLTISDITTFNQIQYDQRITGKKDIRLDCLIVKQFKCKQVIPNQQQLGIIRVIATIDDNLLIIDQDQKVKRWDLKSLMNTRPEGNQVKVNWKKKGWFVDEWEWVVLEFRSEDKAEEFMFFTETNKEVKNQYVV